MLEDALLETCSLDIPETLIVEQAREKFAIMMTEFKDQGESDEKIQSMITKEVGQPLVLLVLLLLVVVAAAAAVVWWCFCLLSLLLMLVKRRGHLRMEISRLQQT